MPLLASIFFGFTPMLIFAYILYWLDRYEKEPKVLLGAVFLWGVIVAAGGAFIINSLVGLGVYLFTGSQTATELTTGSLIAPLVEETLKGMAVLIVFLFFHQEFDSVLDGILYAGVAALGFAATENSYYIYSYGFADGGWSGFWYLVFVRVVLVGWQHPFYTAFSGIGLAMSRLNRSWLVKLAAPLAGFSLAVFAHSLHNVLASLLGGAEGLAIGTILDWGGWFFMFLFILWAIARERRILKEYLREEIAAGLMSPAQYNTAISAGAQSLARLKALFSGAHRATTRFYQLCGELAHKKRQLVQLGDEGANVDIIQGLRGELADLAPRALA
jgi:RsiW-degrading membrane proteinase PrsW (M82 family)